MWRVPPRPRGSALTIPPCAVSELKRSGGVTWWFPGQEGLHGSPAPTSWCFFTGLRAEFPGNEAVRALREGFPGNLSQPLRAKADANVPGKARMTYWKQIMKLMSWWPESMQLWAAAFSHFALCLLRPQTWGLGDTSTAWVGTVAWVCYEWEGRGHWPINKHGSSNL